MPRRTCRPRWAALALPGFLLAALPSATGAWTPGTQLAIASRVADLAPPDLARQIEKHEAEFREGVLAPFRDGDPSRHFQNPDGSGRLAAVIREETDRAVAAIRGHRPFADVVHQLGVLTHYLADANNPLNATQDDGEEGHYFADFLHYAESAQARFAVVFYGLDPRLRRPEDVAPFADRALWRGRELYPHLGQEYRRIGFGEGRHRFDDRSTAFGVASVAFSHAVTDAALLLRYVWIEAGGVDPRRALPGREDDTVLLLTRSFSSP